MKVIANNIGERRSEIATQEHFRFGQAPPAAPPQPNRVRGWARSFGPATHDGAHSLQPADVTCRCRDAIHGPDTGVRSRPEEACVIQQSIRTPLGVTVFGSHVLRVDPDYAVATVTVNRTAAQPAEAFAKTREATDAVRAALRNAGLADKNVQSSLVTLQTVFKHVAGDSQFVGHRASVQFQVVIEQLDELQPLLSGMVEGGADTVHSVTFQTRKLRELRSQARHAATEAARRKAETYCAAASVQLGKPIHIEDVDPDQVTRRGYGYCPLETSPATAPPGCMDVAKRVIHALWALGAARMTQFASSVRAGHLPVRAQPPPGPRRLAHLRAPAPEAAPATMGGEQRRARYAFSASPSTLPSRPTSAIWIPTCSHQRPLSPRGRELLQPGAGWQGRDEDVALANDLGREHLAKHLAQPRDLLAALLAPAPQPARAPAPPRRSSSFRVARAGVTPSAGQPRSRSYGLRAESSPHQVPRPLRSPRPKAVQPPASHVRGNSEGTLVGAVGVRSPLA